MYNLNEMRCHSKYYIEIGLHAHQILMSTACVEPYITNAI